MGVYYCYGGAKAAVHTLVLLSASPASGLAHQTCQYLPLASPLRPAGRACRVRRGSQLALSGEALAVGAVAAGVTAIAATQGLSTLAGAFKLADYRTTSGHDLRLDERLQSKRRQLLPRSEAAPPTRSGSASEEGVYGSGLGVDTDWREEIRLASQLPERDDAAEHGGSTVTMKVQEPGRETEPRLDR